MTETPVVPAERRQLTALFCDLVGSTGLSTAIDPEDYFELLKTVHERSDALIARYGGHVAQHQGDGLLAYFGYPRAHEDATERAVRCALAILESLAALNAELARERCEPLSIRVGIHTGAVVLGSVGTETREILAMGETMNLAARLQSIAAADTIVISADAERLVKGLFSTESLGAQSLKGFSRPVPAYRVIASTGVHGRLGPFGEAALTPFVGRQQPLRTLLGAWEDARRGAGRVVVVVGDAGIGKSRLCRALRERAVDHSHFWLELQCSPLTENTAFYPVIELQKRVLGLSGLVTAAEKLAAFETALSQAGLALDEALPLVATLHGIPLPDDRQLPPTSREAQRRKTLETLSAWLVGLARERPVVLLVEDAQWIDPSTAELVGRVLDHVAAQALLVLFTHRSEFAIPWKSPDAVAIRLERLSEDEARRVVEEVAVGTGLEPERAAELVVRGEGVPLYLEELTKAAVESASPQAASGAALGHEASAPVPATLRDSLMSRLDRLGAAKEIALLASVIGREFSYALLEAAANGEARDLSAQLAKLVESELVFQAEERPEANYRFKHALIRDEAYQSLVRSVRRRFHNQVGAALEARFPEETATRPELVGNHFIEAGETGKGVLYLTMATRRAVTTSANVEALRHATRALGVLGAEPESPGRSQLEMALHTLRGGALIATRGYASHEVQDAFAQARERASALGDSPQLVPVLYGLWLFHMVRGDRKETGELAGQLLAIAESSGDVTAQLFGLTVAGIQGFFEGRFESAVDHIERAFALYDPAMHAPLAVTYALGTAGVARANAATCLWLLGRPDRARDLCREVLESARRDRHPFTLAGVLVMTSMVFQLCGDAVTTRELAEEAHGIAVEQGFPLWIGGALCGSGWAIAVQGQVGEGIARIREGVALFRKTGAQTNMAYVLGHLAQVALAADRVDEATDVVDEALSLTERNLETFYAAELWRLKGEVTLVRTADDVAAAALFERALAIARAERAASLELRIAMSLACLAERRGDRRNAYHLLAPVHDRFTEGLDTRDLRAARALLDRLRANA